MEEIKKISIKDRNYPILLRKIKNPPEVLYYKGEILTKENCFAIVGTRMCSPYGKRVTFEISGKLADLGLTIVSGLAPGIDTFSHMTAVEKRKRTIAVLGTGLDEKSIYPRSNLDLAKKILKIGGCLISEYPPGAQGNRFTFPKRNRIISGLSLGVLVVEAKEKSGALITANWARKQKRKIFAVPGSVYSQNSKGTNLLIKKGATLVEKTDDILNELNLPFSLKEPESVKEGSEEENLILEALREDSLNIDKIIEKTKMPAAKVAGLLAILEIKGRVKNLGGNIFALS